MFARFIGYAVQDFLNSIEVFTSCILSSRCFGCHNWLYRRLIFVSGAKFWPRERNRRGVWNLGSLRSIKDSMCTDTSPPRASPAMPLAIRSRQVFPRARVTQNVIQSRVFLPQLLQVPNYEIGSSHATEYVCGYTSFILRSLD